MAAMHALHKIHAGGEKPYLKARLAAEARLT
jgi:hypothetical protein